MMRRCIYVLMLAALPLGTTVLAQTDLRVDSPYYPNSQWETYANPQELGFDAHQLQDAKLFYDSINAASVLVLYKGRILLNWGDNCRRLRSASVRKSFLHALLGIAYSEGLFSPEDPIGAFKLPEFDMLSKEERTAKVKDLMSTSSGVYLPAAYEAQVWTDRKPSRGSNTPGSTWYYNNWDFNALGAIYNYLTQRDIGDDFYRQIAVPTGMQDFRPELDFKYFYEKDIPIPAYLFKMSARDMARFGLLYLRNGKWKEKQLVDQDWVTMGAKNKTTPWEGTGYGYLWWNTKTSQGDYVYYASGSGVQGIYIVPSRDVVMVFRSDTYMGPEVDSGLDLELLDKILKAQVAPPQQEVQTRLTAWDKQFMSGHERSEFAKLAGTYQNNVTRSLDVSLESDGLVLKTKIADFLMLPVSDHTFWVEDLNVMAEFNHSEAKKYTSVLTKEKLTLYY